MASLPGGGGSRKPTKGRGHGGNAHYMVNLDTGHHLPHLHSSPVKTTAREKALIGPDTIIMASDMGHPPMTMVQHALAGTNVHKHLNGKAKHAHPHDVMTKPGMRAEAMNASAMLPGGGGMP